MRIPHRSSIPALATAALLAACGGGGGDAGPTQPGPGGGSTPVLKSILISAPSNSIVVGNTVQLTAAPRDQNGGVIGAAITWSSSNAAVATVSGSGLVSGVAVGTATISATSGSVSGTQVVTVIPAGGGGTFPLQASVTMPGNSFSPFQTDIARTGTVSYVFGADDHNVIFAGGTGAPADVQVTRNATVNRQFNTVGTFPYDCTLHPGMAGTVVVH